MPAAPPKAPPRPWTNDLEEDFRRILTVGEECISAEELKRLITAKGRDSGAPSSITLYDGFEPSGRMHIAQGVFKAMNVNKCTLEGSNAQFVFWVADWFALMNDKMGGDLNKIKTVGHYLIEVWKAAGMNLDHVVFKWASEEITDNADVYWPTMLDVARRFNITRIKKCCQIMGRKEGSLTAAQVLYPLMQCTDVFFLKADICQLGVDQRKVNMLAREYCEASKIKNKPIILSHHMLYGLKAGQEKMSKSDPDSAIFMEDKAEDVQRKIENAYCPTAADKKEDKAADAVGAIDAGLESMHLVQDELKNPCLDYIQHIIFSPPGATYTAGGIEYTDFATVRDKFLSGEISEKDLKQGLIDSLNVLLEPVRTHFTEDANAKELLELVQKYKKESSAGVTASTPRRLDLAALDMVAAGGGVAFAPLPNTNPTLQSMVGILMQLRQSVAENANTTLWLSDWSARVCNACIADLKGIDAYYEIFVACLQALDADTMAKTKVVKQSEAILADPSNYWISVINAGRAFMLNEVMGDDTVDADGVGIVIARLMRVADVAGLAPSKVYLDATSKVDAEMIPKFISSKLPDMTVPTIVPVDEPNLTLLQRESEAHKTDNDEYYLLDDPKVHGKSKMKKAFCEPGNVEFCPPISLASTFRFDLGVGGSNDITISRSDDNGGDITFTNRQDLLAAFGDESLHPGDLKAASTAVAAGVLDALANGLKDAAKSTKTLKALHKKVSKMKKK